MAGDREVRGPELAALLALPDRHQHLPELDREAAEAGAAGRLRSRRRPTRPPGDPLVESVWIEPYADEQLGLEDGLAGPEARYEQREAVELAFIAALQQLPPNQRAALIMREVLGFSAKEAAETLETTTASINSALQRARATIDQRLPEQSQQQTLRTLGDERVSEIVDAYVDAWGRGDVDAVVGMLTEDAAFTMPPMSTWFGGREEIAIWLAASPLSGDWRWKPLRDARQRPAGTRLSTPGTTSRAATCRSRSTCSPSAAS